MGKRINIWSVRIKIHHRVLCRRNHGAVNLFASVGSAVLFHGQGHSSQGWGVHPWARRVWETKLLYLSRVWLLPAADQHYAAKGWKGDSKYPTDRPGFRGELVLLPYQTCVLHPKGGWWVHLQSDTHGEVQGSLFNDWSVTSVGHHVPVWRRWRRLDSKFCSFVCHCKGKSVFSESVTCSWSNLKLMMFARTPIIWLFGLLWYLHEYFIHIPVYMFQSIAWWCKMLCKLHKKVIIQFRCIHVCAIEIETLHVS